MRWRKVFWACKRDFDFGMLNKEWRGGEIKVTEKFWLEYLQARTVFEDVHYKLVEKVPEEVRNKTKQFDISLKPILCPKCARTFKNEKVLL